MDGNSNKESGEAITRKTPKVSKRKKFLKKVLTFIIIVL